MGKTLLQKTSDKTYSQKETPWYFGAYLNQARHNLYLALNELAIKIGDKPIENDDQILYSKALEILHTEKANPNELEKAMAYYDKNLPFLFYMQYKYESDEERDAKISLRNQGKRTGPVKHMQSSPARYYEILKELIDFLNTARNHYNHYNTVPLNVSSTLIHLLNDIFDVNVRLIKRRFSLDEEQLQHLKRYEGIKFIDGKRKPNRNPNFWYTFFDKQQPNSISDYGLAFFICLFLTKGEAYLFLKKIPGFKRGETPAFKATLETFSSNMLKVPKERLESDNSPQAVFLDMCNELARCPAELFEHLEKDKQQLFIKNPSKEESTDTEMQDNSNGKEEHTDTDISDETEDGPDAKMIRKKDRFLFFAQRYLDITNAFPALRFGVDIGTYCYSSYPKTIAGITETRQLTKHLLGYGKLDDFEKSKRSEKLSNYYKETTDVTAAPDLQYIRETYPHYQTEGNIIPISFVNESARWPDITTTITVDKSYPHKLSKENTLIPTAILSVHEMPALMLYHLLWKERKAGNNVQKVITNHINNLKRFFNDILTGEMGSVSSVPLTKPTGEELKTRSNKEYLQRYNQLCQRLSQYQLQPSYIPDKLVDHLLGIAPADWKQKADRRLREMKKDAEKLVENMEFREHSDIKPGKKGFRKVKVGKLAQLLVEDMMLMQPVLKDEQNELVTGSKANSSAYRLLQSHLAYYGENKNNIIEIFRACNLIQSKNPHPFLHKIGINDKLGIIEFYKAYFREKIHYIDKCMRDKQYERYTFLNVKAAHPEIKLIVTSYLNSSPENHVPFNLPRGLFHNATVDWLKEYGSDETKQFISEHEDTNTVHLAKHLFEERHRDTTQQFYRWGRQYRLFNKTIGKKEYPVFFDLEQRRQKMAMTMINVEKARIKENTRRQEEERNNRNLHSARKNSQPNKEITESLKFLNSYKYFIQTEKYLRLMETQDMLLFMCIKDMLKDGIGDIALSPVESDQTDTFFLKYITSPNDRSNKNPLNRRPAGGVSMDISFYEVNQNGSFKKENNSKIRVGIATIVDKHLKIKNAGNFRKLLKDRRINNFCFYLIPSADNKIIINRMVLENELKTYEEQRLKVLETVATFEKTLFQKSTEEERKEFLNTKGIPEHKLYLRHYFSKHPEVDSEKLELNLNVIRNAFSHNQFPLIREDSFRICPADWQSMHDNFQPSTLGSHKGYGIIQKLGEYGVEQYLTLINNIQ